jgi:putative transposase
VIFEIENLYHIYNQGNNRQKIFFTRENYFFFLKKIRRYIVPYADILAWCLMPNHFHLMVYLHTLEVVSNSDGLTQSETVTKQVNLRNFNDSIGVMLRTYTRAIQKQQNWTGSLFRSATKAQCLTDLKGIAPNYFHTAFGTSIHVNIPEKEYPNVCFNYIHSNPVSAKLVENVEDWEYSSAPDYLGLREGKLINKDRTREFIDLMGL